MIHIRKQVAQNEESEDHFGKLKCYEGFKYAFKILRRFNPKKEQIEAYSLYLLDALKSCLKRVIIIKYLAKLE